MPRLKKRVDEEPVVVSRHREIPETLTAGRSRRTIKPNPKYMNDEMLIPTRNAIEEDNDMSGDEYIVDYEENDDPEDSGLVIRKSVVTSTPQTADGQPKRRGRPPKPKNLDAPRTEPVKNLRKEVLKKMDYKTISISKSRHMAAQFLDGRRRLNLTVESNDGDSADQEEMDDMEMEEHSHASSEHAASRSQKIYNAASLKKHLLGKITDRRSSMPNRQPVHDGTTEEDEYEDEGEYFDDSDAKLSESEPAQKVKRPVGRPRKHPLKQVSPFGGKVLLPGMKTTTSSTPVVKRKAMEMAEEIKQESQQSKMLRRSYGVKSVGGGGASSQSAEMESDENSEARGKQLNRSASFQNLGRGRPPKSAYQSGGGQLSTKSERNVSQGNRSFPEVKSSKPTITIVNVNDIMKMNSKSATDLRRKLEEEADSEDVSEVEEQQTGGRTQDDAKTNNQLVASILERKRPIALEHLQGVRRRDELVRNRVVELKPKRAGRDVSEMLTEEDIVDFEDVLQKNIVSANKGARSITIGAVRGRGRPPSHSPQDENYSGSYGSPNAKRYPQQGNRQSVGKPVATTRRSLQPPRILNATMKLGDNHPRSKMSSGSGDNHYSIDLSDPDNNVKLVASSNENSPIKRSPASSGPVATTLSQKPVAGTVAKPLAGGRERARSPLEAKKKRVTVYETWNVLQIKSIDSSQKLPHLALSMISLGNIADEIKLPSSAWAYRTTVEERKVPPADGDEVFIGKTADLTIKEEDKVRYEPNKIIFRRKAASPGRFNVQFDRLVTFCNDTYKLNVDGQSCKLMGAPSRLETVEDIETLLMIVDFVDLKNGCLELPPSARMVARDSAVATKRFVGSKDPVII